MLTAWRVRICSVVLLALSLTVSAALSAAAEGKRSTSTSDGANAQNTSDSSAKVSASTSDGPSSAPQSSPPPQSSGGTDPCTYTTVDIAPGGPGDKTYFTQAAQAIADSQAKQGQPNWDQGSYVYVYCPGQAPYGYYSIPGAADAPPLPSVYDLAAQATQSVTVTTPPVNFSPYWPLNDGRYATLKNAETWVWIDPANWTGHTPRVEAGPVWVEATITPTQILITANDGSTEPATCDGPGTPITDGVPLSEPSPTCSLKFTKQTDGNTWPVTIQVIYSASWTGFNGATTVSGTLDNLISAPTTYPLAVLTSKTRLVDPNASD